MKNKKKVSQFKKISTLGLNPGLKLLVSINLDGNNKFIAIARTQILMHKNDKDRYKKITKRINLNRCPD